MKIEIRTDFAADIRIADVFEVVSVEDDLVTLQRVYRPKEQPTMQPPTLGVSVGDGVGIGDKAGQ